MVKKTLIGIGATVIFIFIATIIFQNYIATPLTAYQATTFWKEYEQNKKVQEDAIIKFPEPIGIINDYSKMFTESQQNELTKIFYDYDIKTTRQIVIVTIDSILPYQDIQKYATDLGNEWGIGNKEKNNGLTIVVCKPCRKIGIATGLGTELILTDQICEEVIKKIIIPEFKNGEFYNGIKKGAIELIDKWK